MIHHCLLCKVVQFHVSLLRDEAGEVFDEVGLPELVGDLADFGDRVVSDDLAVLVRDEKGSSPDIVDSPTVEVHPDDVACLGSSQRIDGALGHAVEDSEAITAVDEVSRGGVAAGIRYVRSLIDETRENVRISVLFTVEATRTVRAVHFGVVLGVPLLQLQDEVVSLLLKRLSVLAEFP